MGLFLNFEPALRRNLAIFFAASLCFWAGLAGMLPNLSLYIESFGASNQEIGWVMAAFAIGLLGFRPKMSRFTDRAGRKPALLIGVSVIAIAPLLYLSVSAVPNLMLHIPGTNWQIGTAVLLLGVTRAFHGISIAAFATAYSAVIADMAPPQHRGELIGYMSLATPIGMAIGPALGGYLEASFSLAFLTMTALGMVGTLCVLASQEPPRANAIAPASVTAATADRPIGNHQPRRSPVFWRLLFTPPIRVPALILFMVGIAFGSMVAFVPLYVRQAGIDINIGLIYTVSALASFSIRAIAGRASDKLGRGRFISLGLIFYTLAMLTLTLANTAPMLLLAGILQGAGGGTLIPIIAALMTDRSRPHERGLTFGLCLTGFDLGIALAGPVMGQLADANNSYTLVFALAGIMTFLGLIIFITASSKDLIHSIHFALNDGRDVYAIK
ncbi:MAG: MFS transporter [Phormidesmis sp. RL_2_1]|nr:MFS transporter [Phormidesmis sp. RL_2_1]